MSSDNQKGSRLYALFLLRDIYAVLSPASRRAFSICLAVTVMTAIVELLAVGAIFPFIELIAKPAGSPSRALFLNLNQWLPDMAGHSLAFAATVVFVLLTLASSALRMLQLRLNARAPFAAGTELASKIVERFFSQPYEKQLASNSAALISLVTDKIRTIVLYGFFAFLQAVASAVLVAFFLIGLLLINPVLVVVLGLIFGIPYFLLGRYQQNSLGILGDIVASRESDCVKLIQEACGSARDIILDGSQRLLAESYARMDEALQVARAQILLMSSSPRIIFDGVGLTMIALFTFLLTLWKPDITDSLGMIALLVLGAQRLIPALQQGYASWSSINGAQAAFEQVVSALNAERMPVSDSRDATGRNLSDFGTISFRNVSFRYAGSESYALKKVSLDIERGSCVALIGTSGSGKSTLADILLGLLPPSDGQLCIDDVVLDSTKVQHWQKIVAHVPQSIFLLDKTIHENVAMAEANEPNSRDRVMAALNDVQLSQLIAGLPEGLMTNCGERGTRLSGGQMQRIGLARALFKRARVLVLDEATSALDTDTERAVLDTIYNLSPAITVVFITHRIPTIRKCDRIFLLEEGDLTASGTYDSLMKESERFRNFSSGH